MPVCGAKGRAYAPARQAIQLPAALVRRLAPTLLEQWLGAPPMASEELGEVALCPLFDTVPSVDQAMVAARARALVHLMAQPGAPQCQGAGGRFI